MMKVEHVVKTTSYKDYYAICVCRYLVLFKKLPLLIIDKLDMLQQFGTFIFLVTVLLQGM